MVSERRKRELIEEHRDINVEHDDWYGHIFDQTIGDLDDRGIDVSAKNIQFSGFSCQGDGASFTGVIDTTRFLKAHPALSEKFPAVTFWVTREDPDWDEVISLKLKRGSSAYSHHNTVYLDCEVWYDRVEGKDPVTEGVLRVWCRKVDQEILPFEKQVEEICRGYMQDLYRDLEREYDYQTSDEQVWASIEANDLVTLDEEDDEEDLTDAGDDDVLVIAA